MAKPKFRSGHFQAFSDNPTNMTYTTLIVLLVCFVYILVNTIVKDGLPYLFHSFRNKYFNKISLGNMLYFQNKL